jgi:hypothetical protein
MGLGLWDWIMIQLKGDDIALLGRRLSGKTTLYEFLAHGVSTPDAPEGTVGPTPTAQFRNKDLGLTVHRGLDLPGADHFYPDWERQFRKSSKAFYLFDAHELRTNLEYADWVRLDGKKIKEWGTAGKRVMLLGTHADTDPENLALGHTGYSDCILDHDVIVGFQTRAQVRASAVGSLTAGDDAIAALLKLVLT